jgi:hypothetical protein
MWGSKSDEEPKQIQEEVPIYQGKHIVGYRKEHKK